VAGPQVGDVVARVKANLARLVESRFDVLLA